MPAQSLATCLRWLWFGLLLAWAPLAPASAQGAADGAACHAYSSATTPLGQAGRLQWVCGDKGWRDGAAVSWLRFPVDRGAPAPRVFASRITVFRAIDIAAVAADGTLRIRHYRPADARAVLDGAVFALPLPPARADTVAWLVRIERPHSVTVASEARLDDGSRSDGSLIDVIILALVAGMLIMPLLFDLNFYLVLRERFVLLHAAMVLAMIGYVLFSGGLLTAFATASISFMAIAGPLTWAVATGIGGLFIIEFLEPGTLPPRLERAVAVAAWCAMIVPGFASLQFEATQPFDNTLYFLAYLPVIPTYCVAIVVALLRGSHSARFLAVAWTPVIAASCMRLLRGLGAYVGQSSLDRSLFVAMGIEVIIIALGVADRFLAIRRERDRALSAARSLEELSERDPLTGLLNRRALECRFALLRAEGFTALAVVDLDRFKSINDTHGHAVGDRVLEAVARVLEQDADTLAFRIGGEEFLLLLRGSDAVQRAERRRQAIAVRIAEEVDGLDRVVTASMGLIEMPMSVMPRAAFAELYERADRLLYEAKQAGRNRTMSERLKTFVPRKTERRKAAA